MFVTVSHCLGNKNALWDRLDALWDMLDALWDMLMHWEINSNLMRGSIQMQHAYVPTRSA